MMHTHTIIFCEDFIRDADTDRVTAIKIVDNIVATHWPIFLPSFCLIAFTEREKNDDAKFDCRVVISLDKKSLFEDVVSIDFKDKYSNRAMIRLLGFVIPTPGKLEARLMHGRKKLGSFQVDIRASTSQTIKQE
jgi:hypothetical protein